MSATAIGRTLPLDALDLAPDEVRARLRAARRRGQPAWLWPDVPVEDWRTALRRIETVARAVLVGAPAPAVLRAEGREAVHALGVAAYTSGMGPLLGYWLETGALETSPDARSLLGLHLLHGRLRAERVQAEARRALAQLSAAGVSTVVLKGLHTAHAYFPEPGTRPVADIDLLVEPGELSAAEAALAAGGYEGGRAQHGPYKREWGPRGQPGEPRSLELAHAGDRLAIDLHASPARNFFGVALVHPGSAPYATRAWALPTPAGDVAARVLAQPTLTLFLALHASEGLHNLTLVRLLELALVLRADGSAGGPEGEVEGGGKGGGEGEVEGSGKGRSEGEAAAQLGMPGSRGRPVPVSPRPRVPASAEPRDSLHWGQLVDEAEAAGALRFAYPAFSLCERLLPGTVPAWVLARCAAAATPAQRRVLASLEPATAQRLERLSLEERFMWAGTPAERMRRLLHGAWPAPAGRSAAELGRIYAERTWRVLRGRVVR